MQSHLNQPPTLALILSAVSLIAESNGVKVRGWFKWDWESCYTCLDCYKYDLKLFCFQDLVDACFKKCIAKPDASLSNSQKVSQVIQCANLLGIQLISWGLSIVQMSSIDFMRKLHSIVIYLLLKYQCCNLTWGI